MLVLPAFGTLANSITMGLRAPLNLAKAASARSTAIYRELANLRERMAKLEGVVEGFMRGQIPWDAAQTPLRELPVLSSGR